MPEILKRSVPGGVDNIVLDCTIVRLMKRQDDVFYAQQWHMFRKIK